MPLSPYPPSEPPLIQALLWPVLEGGEGYRGRVVFPYTVGTSPCIPPPPLPGPHCFPGISPSRGRGIGVQGNRCRALHPRDPYPHYPLSPLYARTCTPGIYGGTSRGYRCWGRGCTVKRSIPLPAIPRTPPPYPLPPPVLVREVQAVSGGGYGGRGIPV